MGDSERARVSVRERKRVSVIERKRVRERERERERERVRGVHTQSPVSFGSRVLELLLTRLRNLGLSNLLL